MEKYLVFYLNEKELAAYTLRGTFPGEREATIDLLAHENGVDPTAIRTEYEDR
jgi:hypothetical protein